MSTIIIISHGSTPSGESATEEKEFETAAEAIAYLQSLESDS